MVNINFVLNHSVERAFNLFAPGNLKGAKSISGFGFLVFERGKL